MKLSDINDLSQKMYSIRGEGIDGTEWFFTGSTSVPFAGLKNLPEAELVNAACALAWERRWFSIDPCDAEIFLSEAQARRLFTALVRLPHINTMNLRVHELFQ